MIENLRSMSDAQAPRSIGASTKNCIRKNDSKLNRMTKRIASRLRYYEFLLKLKYKCELNGNSAAPH